MVFSFSIKCEVTTTTQALDLDRENSHSLNSFYKLEEKEPTDEKRKLGEKSTTFCC